MKPISIVRVVLCSATLAACDKPAEKSQPSEKSSAVPQPSAAANSLPESPPAVSAPAVSVPISPLKQGAPNQAVVPPSKSTPPVVPDAPVISAKQASLIKEALAQTDVATRESALLSALNEMPVATAADLALATLPADAVREHVLGQLLADSAVKDPAQTAAWLAQAADFPEKNQAIRRTADYWQRVDFGATLQWASQLREGAERDNALYPIAAHIRACPENQRKQSLDAITNATLRKSVENLLDSMASEN